jgi:hypothetical protein
MDQQQLIRRQINEASQTDFAAIEDDLKLREKRSAVTPAICFSPVRSHAPRRRRASAG